MESLFPQALESRIQNCGAIAVLIIDDAKDAIPVGEALVAGGIDAIELTLRTPAAIESARQIRERLPDVAVGIGTVLTPEQINEICDVGVDFAVSPGLNRRVVERAMDKGLPFAPGITTPSEIEAAIELGCRDLKFFPAEPSGGIKYLKSAAAPYLHLDLRFIPLGGLSAQNMTSYLREPIISAIGGSWIASRDLIQAQDWSKISARATEARQLVDAARNGETT